MTHAASPPVRLTLLLAALLASIAGCTKPPAPADPVRPVLARKVILADAVEPSVYAGEIRARYETDLGFRVPGKLIAREVDVGATVKRGARLARLDPADAALSATAARAQVAAARTDLDFAQGELERYRTLLAKGFVGRSVFDAKQNAYDAAHARLKAAEAQAGVSGNQSTYTALYADNDGIITAVLAEAGQVVQAGQAVYRLARPEEKEAVINVPEGDTADLVPGRPALIRLWANSERTFPGKVREVAPNADAATRTFQVKVTVLDGDPKVRLGMTATVGFVDSRAKVALIPLSGVYEREGKPAVWVVDPQSQRVNLRPVHVVAYRDTGAVVSEGLANGDVIVTAGVHKLVPNQQVRVLDDAAEAPRS